MKIASRFLLPLELLSALLMVSWGIAGWIGGGLLWKSLSQEGLNAEWGLCLCAVGIAQLAPASMESVYGLNWSSQRLLRSVNIRFWAAFVAVPVWFYVCFLMVTLRGADVCALMIQAPAALLACVMIAAHNRKVACVLDPAVPTHELEKRVREEPANCWNVEKETAPRARL